MTCISSLGFTAIITYLINGPSILSVIKFWLSDAIVSRLSWSLLQRCLLWNRLGRTCNFGRSLNYGIPRKLSKSLFSARIVCTTLHRPKSKLLDLTCTPITFWALFPHFCPRGKACWGVHTNQIGFCFSMWYMLMLVKSARHACIPCIGIYRVLYCVNNAIFIHLKPLKVVSPCSLHGRT